jgi:hypothetical protein
MTKTSPPRKFSVQVRIPGGPRQDDARRPIARVCNASSDSSTERMVRFDPGRSSRERDARSHPYPSFDAMAVGHAGSGIIVDVSDTGANANEAR